MSQLKLSIGLAAFCLALLANAVIVRADVPTTEPTTQPSTQPSDTQLQPLVQMLGDPDPTNCDAAQIILLAQPLALPSYQAALKAGGLTDASKKRLLHIVDVLQPGYAARCRRWQALQDRIAWATQSDLQAYHTIGSHDPKWDSQVESAIESYVLQADSANENRKHISSLCQAAISEGCKDPFVVFMQASCDAHLGPRRDSNLHDAFLNAADGLLKSQYPSILRAGGTVDVVQYYPILDQDQNPDSWANTRSMADAALALLPQAAKDPTMPKVRIYTCATGLFNIYKSLFKDEKQAFDTVFPVLQSCLPNDPSPLLFKGSFYTNYAWTARGNGVASTVSDAQSKLFQDRLQIAADAEQQAYQMNPDDPRAPTQMLTVELGQGNGRQVMETWFQRAVSADPDNYEACSKKAYYLEPKWYGSPEDMLQFGRECFATENWSCRIPLVLGDARATLARYQSDSAAYFRDPAVWADIDKSYFDYLLAHPNDYVARSYYTLLACKSRQWSIARDQFTTLGNHAVYRTFGGKQAYLNYLSQAEQQAVPTTQDR